MAGTPSEPTTPALRGSCDPRFAAVRDAFADSFESHGERGASLAVLVDGRAVVDLHGGWADEARTRPWREDTLVNVFSVGKGVATLCLLRLVERGTLDLDEPVARRWPEFAAGGKAEVTVRQVLCHRAGLPAVRRALEADALYDWERMTGALAAETPWWKPGTAHGYHVNTFGFLVGEILRRASGVHFGALLRRELTGPLSADFHVGLEERDLDRVADFTWNPALEMPAAPDFDSLDDAGLLWWNTHFNPPGVSGHGVVNTTRWRRAQVPSTNPHATALGIARIHQVMAGMGAVDGRHVLASSLVREAATQHSAGMDLLLARNTRFGLGFQLPSRSSPISPNEGTVLHFGAGGALGLADPTCGVALGYAVARMGPRSDNPAPRAIVQALYSCL